MAATQTLFPNHDGRRPTAIRTKVDVPTGAIEEIQLDWRVPSNVALGNGQPVPDEVFRQIFRPALRDGVPVIELACAVRGVIVFPD